MRGSVPCPMAIPDIFVLSVHHNISCPNQVVISIFACCWNGARVFINERTCCNGISRGGSKGYELLAEDSRYLEMAIARFFSHPRPPSV